MGLQKNQVKEKSASSAPGKARWCRIWPSKNFLTSNFWQAKGLLRPKIYVCILQKRIHSLFYEPVSKFNSLSTSR